MVIQFIPRCFGVSFLNSKSYIASSELFVADLPVSCHFTISIHLRWRQVLSYVTHILYALGVVEDFNFEEFHNIIANILHMVLVDASVFSPHALSQLEP